MDKLLVHYDVRYHPSRNGWQTIRCPNEYAHQHGDKNPSARVNIVEGAFICHACGVKGDAYSVWMGINGVDFMAAKKELGGDTFRPESSYLI